MTTAALSITTWVPISAIDHVYPGPRCYPGRSVFPSPVGGLGFPAGPSLPTGRFKHRHAYTPPASGLHCARHAVAVTSFMSSVSHDAASSMPAKSESPFASSGCYPSKGDVYHHLNSHYATFLAHAGSCASSIALPSASLLHSPTGSLPVAVGPGWTSNLPDLISANPSLDVWPPTPAGSEVHLLVSSLGSSAFPKFEIGRLPCHDSADGDFTAGSHFGAADIL